MPLFKVRACSIDKPAAIAKEERLEKPGKCMQTGGASGRGVVAALSATLGCIARVRRGQICTQVAP